MSWQFAVTNLSRVLATCLTSLKIVLVRKVTDLSVPGVYGDFQENDTFTLSMDAIFTY